MLRHYDEAMKALTTSHDLDPSPESAAGMSACQEQLDQVSA